MRTGWPNTGSRIGNPRHVGDPGRAPSQRSRSRPRGRGDAVRSGPLIVPVAILAEVAYFLERDFRPPSLDLFVEDLVTGAYTLDCGESDILRMRVLIRRYHDLPLEIADVAVIACAERHGGKVMTLDLRHFSVVAREGTMTIVP